ncbi:unnamed protein product [Soboliphyme baturini]|uniref:Uncharacterized protein n=1 Tax=Soboliphyme baturini TaxID=241478 RepID=A0A183I9J7_9BILA|nr:unnamed protein product [Soboliphyme baturini]
MCLSLYVRWQRDQHRRKLLRPSRSSRNDCQRNNERQATYVSGSHQPDSHLLGFGGAGRKDQLLNSTLLKVLNFAL